MIMVMMIPVKRAKKNCPETDDDDNSVSSAATADSIGYEREVHILCNDDNDGDSDDTMTR